MPVEFRVLGPLDLRRDGSPVSLRAAKPRKLLAILLVHHGRVVSKDRLVEYLWPESPPAGAEHAIESHVSRLRSLLGDDLPLVARPPGYVLEIDPQSLDSVRFEQLLAEARASEPARAAARAADALALWRGDALADFSFESFAQAEIARLEELRQEAEEERVEAELATGKASELVGELEALVQVVPPRERRYRQLMVALYRSGRQQAALDVYKTARAALAEGGLEPTPALRELERAILEQAPGLDAVPVGRANAQRERRLVSVAAVAPDISLELDPEEHERQRSRAADGVAAVAAAYDALQPEPFLLVFAQEDHPARASAAATAIRDALGASVAVETGEALVGNGAAGGPVVERARRRARDGGAPAAPAPPLERRLEGPFVGREVELARLRQSRAALVTGPPGIGKSRLARELAREERVVVGRCSSYGSEAIAPLIEIARSLGSPGAFDDVPAPEVPLAFRRLCEASPRMAVVFDDVHWADALVLETIELLVARGDGVRVFCLAREELLEEQPSFLAAADHVTLEPLSTLEARNLAALLGTEDDSIVERAEGNPLFIEQLLAHATEGGDAIPPSLRSLLTARLDRLTPVERASIECAAIVGREFDGEIVAELSEAQSVRAPLASLVRRGLLDPAPPSAAFEERFRFRHALIHEAAYAAITKGDRARLHEAAADLLEVRGASDEIVGFHLEQAAGLLPSDDRRAAKIAEDAGRHLAAAGIAAWKRSDARAAVRLCERAAALLPDRDPQRLELLCELGVALNTIGEPVRACETLREAAGLGERRIELRARFEEGLIATLTDSRDASHLLELADEGRPVFEALGDDRALGRVWMAAGWVRGGAFGQSAEWKEAAERALVHYQRAGWPTTTCIGHIAAALYLGPAPVPTAIEQCTALRDDAVDDLAGEASVSAHLGGLHAMAARFDDASRLLSRAREIYTDLGFVPSLLLTCAPLEARAARLRDDLEGAAATLTDSCRQLVGAHRGFHLTTQAAELADVLCELGQLDGAEEWCGVAERHARADDFSGGVSVGIARARLLARTGATHEATVLAREAISLADRTDELNLRAAARVALADVLDLAERRAEASVELAAAAALYEAKGNAAATARLSRKRGAAAFSASAS
jgi:DNA-binding SARP family transcriptional activator